MKKKRHVIGAYDMFFALGKTHKFYAKRRRQHRNQVYFLATLATACAREWTCNFS